MLAAQASALPFKSNCGASAIASKTVRHIIAAQVFTSGNYIMLAGTEYENILELFAARQNSWFMTQDEVALKKVGHIA